MSFNGSGDEQSEDGELRHSPEVKAKNEAIEFSASDDDGETMDSLDIKPPQATMASLKSKKNLDTRGHYKKTDRYREERTHLHRSKHHSREKSSRSTSDRERYQRDKERYQKEQAYKDTAYKDQAYKDQAYKDQAYKEQAYKDQVYKDQAYKDQAYKDQAYKDQAYKDQAYKDHPYKDPYGEIQYLKERERKEESGRARRHGSLRKHEERKLKDSRDAGYSGREGEKHRRERHEEHRERSSADKALHDLRQKLLIKRHIKEDDGRGDKVESRRESRKYKEESSAFAGEAGAYVKEMIDMTTSEDKKYKKEEDKLTEEERIEQENRRLRLLEAEREMARLKEQSKLERARRHLEKQAKRKLEEAEAETKRLRLQETQVVTVSDNSDEEVMDVDYMDVDRNSEASNASEREKRSRSRETIRSSESRENSPSPERRFNSRSRSVSESGSRSRSVSRSRSRSRSSNRSQSNSASPESTETKQITETLEEEPTLLIDTDLPPYYPAIQGCRSVEEFQCLNRIEEGTYGVVYRAKDKRTSEIVALKRLKMEKEKEGFPITSLREINTLLKGQHPNIVTVREIVVGSNMDKIFIVMDYVEHDLKSLMETMRHKKQNFTPGEVKCLLKQLLKAVAHLHDNWILHRDLKTSNLLLSHKGILKVGDFGLAREYGSPLKAYTPIVVTLWYRAPELLLCTKEYSTPIDIWSVGCIFAELLLMNALFPGKSEVDQLNRVFKDLGTPNEKIWTGFNKLPAVQKMKFTEYPVSNLRSRFNMLTEQGLSLLKGFLTYDPVKRITSEDALKHPYFDEVPLPIDPAMFPTWPAKSELGHRRALAASPKPPSGGREYKQLGDNDDEGIGFRITVSGADVRRLAMGGGFSLKF